MVYALLGLGICSYIAAKDLRAWLIKFLLFFFIFLCSSFLLPPNNDHHAYIKQAHSIVNSPIAYFWHAGPLHITSSIHALFYKFSQSFKISVPFVNAIFVASIFASANFFFDKKTFNYLLLIPVLLNSTVVYLGVSANKDFPILLFLITSTFSLCKIFQSKLGPDTLKYLAIFILSLLLIRHLRGYLFLILATSFSVSLFVTSLNLKKQINILALFGILLFVASIVIHIQWDDIRRLIHTYEGRAQIDLLLRQTSPDLLSAMAYSFLSFFWAFFGIFIDAILGNLYLVETSKVLAGMIEGLFFTGIVLFLIKSNRCQLLTNLILGFLFLHLTIQFWGSPNYGSLVRLRIHEYIIGILAIQIYASKSPSVLSESTS